MPANYKTTHAIKLIYIYIYNWINELQYREWDSSVTLICCLLTM